MRARTRGLPIVLAGLTGALLGLGPVAAEPRQGQSANEEPPAERFVKGELIVTFTDSVTECVHHLVKSKKLLEGQKSPYAKTVFKRATSDQSDSLDKRFEAHQIRSARPLFRNELEEEKIVGPKTLAALKTLHADRQAAVKAKFPQRAARAPSHAVLPDLSHIYVVTFPPELPVETVAADLKSDPHIRSVELNSYYQLQAFPQDPPSDPYYSSCNSWGQGCPPDGYDDLWGVKQVKANLAWPTTQGRRSDTTQPIVVAVVDTGVDYTHPDLNDNIWTNLAETVNGVDDGDANLEVDDIRGYNFVSRNNDTQDRYGHGTHIAGTIAAEANNAEGVIGVAPQVQIMSVKVGSDLITTSELVAQGIDYAAITGADVINVSYANPTPKAVDTALTNAVYNAYVQGAIVVFAAGNSSDDVANYAPQNQPWPIVVAATDPDDALRATSNRGALVDLAAPGEQILSTLSSQASSNFRADCPSLAGPYCHTSGTSMAAPHVAAAAALLLAYRPSLSIEAVRQALRITADPTQAEASAATNAGLPSDAFSTAQSVSAPLIYIAGPTCDGTGCNMWENSAGTFNPLTIFVTAIDLEDQLNSLTMILPNPPAKPDGATFQVTPVDAGTKEGMFVWSMTSAGQPVSFQSLNRCTTSPNYSVTFSATDSAFNTRKRTIPITLQRNPGISHPPVAIPSTEGYVTWNGIGPILYPGYVDPGKQFYLKGWKSCDPDVGGLVTQWYWEYTGNNPPPALTREQLGLPDFSSYRGTSGFTGMAPASVTQDTWLNFTLQVKDNSGLWSTVKNTSIKIEVPPCFIATAAYGSPLVPELDVLRAYRDTRIARTPQGQLLIDFYYRMAPPVARFIADKPWLRALVRGLLTPIVAWTSQQMATDPTSGQPVGEAP